MRQTRFLVRLSLAGLLLTGTLLGQMQVGDNTRFNLGGSVGFGYSGGFGDTGISSHGLTLNGNANASGYYYNPNFISFSLQPFYNRSQSNSNSQSITNDSGLIGSMNFFAGSHFPGTITYDREFNTTGEYGLPGVAGFATHGSTQGYGITWGANLPKLPTLQVSYTSTGSDATIFGTTGDSKNSFKNLNLFSTYLLKGWQLNSNYSRQNSHTELPAFISGGTTGDGNSSTYGFSVSHKIPFSGSFGASWTQSAYENATTAGPNTGNTDSATITAGITPIRKVTIYTNLRYTGNLVGAYQQSLAASGITSPIAVDNTSNSLGVDTMVTYSPNRLIGFAGHVNHRMQHYSGRDITDTQFGGNVNINYARPFLGSLIFSVGVVDSASEQGNNGAGLVGNVGFARRIRGWNTSADFSYSQNVQTLIALYTTSSFTYGASVRRKVTANSYWSASARAAHSGISQQAGSNNRSENINSIFNWRRYSFSGNYSQSFGTSILGANGQLTPTQPLPGLIPADYVFFNAKSWGGGIGVSPFRKMVVTANYSQVKSDTSAHSLASMNAGRRYDAVVEYRLRKMDFRGGFNRLQQSIGASGASPTVVNSYYFGISRWFSIF